jgi:hypothetical protein
MLKSCFRKVNRYSLIIIILFFTGLPLIGISESTDHNNNTEDIKRGRRFFMGFLPKDRKHESCVSCHILVKTDTLNWYPSAADIASKFASKDFNLFFQAVMSPTGKKLGEAHKDFKISNEDLFKVKAYLDDLSVQAYKPKHDIGNLLLFLFLGVLMAWALIDILFLNKIKYRIIPTVILLGAFSWQMKMVAHDAIRLGRQINYAPDQPVKFSHKVHAGDNGIDCKYCHTTVTHGKSAGIPSSELCMNCHTLIREGTHSGKFEIAKVVEAYESGKPIEWIRIHNLPDHVFFNHANHAGAQKLDCTKCHGDVKNMDIMKQHSDLSMGWCVNCHRETKVDFLGNEYYSKFVKLHEDLKSGKIDSITAQDTGANQCSRCHY